MPNAKADYKFVPTVVFSHPVIGTIGYTEEAARKEFGDKIKVYNSTFVNLWYGPYYKGEQKGEKPNEKKPVTKYKLICLGDEEKVIGLHAIGTYPVADYRTDIKVMPPRMVA
jgi:glutathione reductase (NADPH)